MTSKQIWLKPSQAFKLWINAPSDIEQTTMARLFDCFGGIESKYYQKWTKEENINLLNKKDE